ncbi:MAG: DUF3662 domain-containing protein [Anaerolineales bacterium]|nr:DUF3662 domain-containing protein [Anaerolineales bacterium]
MTRIEERLTRLETRLQVFVEGAAGRLFPGGRLNDLLAQRLMAAVRLGLRVEPDGQLVAPDHLAIQVCPADLELFSSLHALIEVETVLRQIGAEQGVRFPQERFLLVETSAQLAPGEVFIAPCDERGAISETTDTSMPEEAGEAPPRGAYLIVDGMHVFPLDQPTINLGRRPDNQLVIDDARVSRTHAQLRLVRGRFVVFDLDSRGGTFVNGKRVLQQALQPGDVISLAGVPLVFGMEDALLGETQDLAPLP